MRVYLIGEQGGRTAFKITTARVSTSLDHIARETLNEIMDELNKDTWWISHKTVTTQLCSTHTKNIYYAELDQLDKPARKLNEKIFKEAIKDFLEENKVEIKKLEAKRLRLIRERD